jgi:hypothetical protein
LRRYEAARRRPHAGRSNRGEERTQLVADVQPGGHRRRGVLPQRPQRGLRARRHPRGHSQQGRPGAQPLQPLLQKRLLGHPDGGSS